MLHPAHAVNHLRVLGAAEMAALLDIDSHTLHMRLARNSGSVPPPDRKLNGCSIWFATSDLADMLGVPIGRVVTHSVGP